MREESYYVVRNGNLFVFELRLMQLYGMGVLLLFEMGGVLY